MILPGAPGAEPLVEGPIGVGSTYYSRTGPQQADVVYLAEQGTAPLRLRVTGDRDEELQPGSRLAIRAGAPKFEPPESWLSENAAGIDRQLGVTAAGIGRGRRDIHDSLFRNVISWDRTGQYPEVIARIPFKPPPPEVREVEATVRAQVRTTTGRGGPPAPPRIPLANEMPPLSPAAGSVAGIVPALENNRRAEDLLLRTGSRGLGFNGPRLLALPPFINRPAGVRTFGPAGLGARP
jgi:hypothetical protein